MACGCRKNLDLMTERATRFALKVHQDVQLYSYLDNGITLYMYELINPSRENVLKIIKHDAI